MLCLNLFAGDPGNSTVTFYHPEYEPLELKLLQCLKHGYVVFALRSEDLETRDAVRQYEERQVMPGVTVRFDRVHTGECRVLIDAPKSVEVWRKKIDPNRREAGRGQEGL